MDSLTEVTSLGQYGLVGVMIALILLCGGLGYFLWKLASNHIQHNTEATIENTKVLSALHELIKNKLD